MLSQENIKAALAAEVERAVARYRITAAEFRAMMDGVPSGMPRVGLVFPLKDLERERSAAVKELCHAVQRYDDFVLHGKVPDDLKIPAESQS